MKMITREAHDSELRKREELEPAVRWWAKQPDRLKIIRSRHSEESASGASAVLRASYLNGVAVSTEELAAELQWRPERVLYERRKAIAKVIRAYKQRKGAMPNDESSG